jgi:subtilase family serine protease
MAWVDDVNRIANESNEENNQYNASITVAAGKPDLIVTDISMSPASPVSGDAVVLTATIKNQGTAATPAGVIHGVSFWVNDVQVSWSDTYTSSIAPGASVTLTANGGPTGSSTWTAIEGTHTLMAWVDDVNRIANESNEENNQYSTIVAVSQPPEPTPTVKPKPRNKA